MYTKRSYFIIIFIYIKKIESFISPETIIASNTSTLPITGLASFSKNPQIIVKKGFINNIFQKVYILVYFTRKFIKNSQKNQLKHKISISYYIF